MSTEHHLAWVERQAQGLRKELSLSPLDILDPFVLAKQMKVLVLTPDKVIGVPRDAIEHLLNGGADHWSAGCIKVPNVNPIIVYNPTHAATRLRATMMEELSHLYLNHKGSQLHVFAAGIATRSYDRKEEEEAKWVGAAALLPQAVLAAALHRGVTKRGLAMEHGVSVHLVTFRCNVTRTSLGT